MPQAFAPLAYVLAFLAVVILIQTLSGLLFSAGDKSRRVNRRLTMQASGMSREQVYSALLRGTPAPWIKNEGLLNYYRKADLLLIQAGLQTTPIKVFGVLAGVAAALWFAGLALISVRGGNPLTEGGPALVGAVVLAMLGAVFWIDRRRQARLKLIGEQLPLALEVATRALRAGHPVVSAVQLAADEMGDPVGSEFGLIVDETTYGAEFKEALVNFARRTGSQDAHYFAVAVSIQSETGGNLAEILDGLTRVMRGRGTLVKRVKALSSEGLASAYVLSALPIGLVGMVLLSNPKFYTSKFSDPLFWPIVSAIVALYICGWLMIRRIMNFKY
jgi:tight adherence protein B